MILDVATPAMNGPNLQSEAMPRGHGIPVVFITAQDDGTFRVLPIQRQRPASGDPSGLGLKFCDPPV